MLSQLFPNNQYVLDTYIIFPLVFCFVCFFANCKVFYFVAGTSHDQYLADPPSSQHPQFDQTKDPRGGNQPHQFPSRYGFSRDEPIGRLENS